MSKRNAEEGFIHLLILVGLVVVFLIIGLIILANIKTTKEFPQVDSKIKGVLIAKGGDDDGGSSGSGSSGSSGSGSSGSGSSNSGSSGSDSSGDSNTSGTGTGSSNTSTTTKTEFNIKPSSSSSVTSGVRVRTKESADKQKTEIKFSETEKIKTRIEDDRTRIDVYSGGIKVRYEWRDGRFIVKAENEAGDQVDVPEQELFKIDDRLNSSGIKVATDGGKLIIAKNNIGAVSNFPFQIDLDSNQLIASTSAGVRVLTILPDQAVQNLIAANVISKLDAADLVNQVQLGNVTSVQDVIALGERNGLPVYEVNGIKEQKLLGFIPVSTEAKVFVSAETGEPVAQEQTLLANAIDFLSI